MNFSHDKQRFWQMLSIFSVVVFFCLLGFSIYYLNIDSRALDEIVEKNVERVAVITDELNGVVEDECDGCVRRYIDGVYDSSENQNLYPYAVIIDNNEAARPQYGIGQANVVYEIEAEGGITRFLGIFGSNQELEKIGPIRSVRPYFLDIASEYAALIAHVGGSPQALARILSDNILNINEFYRETYFWRGEDKVAPHNVYSSSDKLNEYLELKKATDGKFFSWSFKDDEKPNGSAEVRDVVINYRNDDYRVIWRYNGEENAYDRYLAGEKHEVDGEQVRVKNVIIQYVKTDVIDNEGRLDIDLLGVGKTLICLDGSCNEGEWKKKTRQSRTRFYVNEEEVRLNSGKIWINLVRVNSNVEY